MRRDATYHVRIYPAGETMFYIGEHRRPVSDIQHALIYSRAGALAEAEETRAHCAAQGLVATVQAVMLCANGAIRVVRKG